MSIQFIVGRAGTGKSQYCFERIQQNLEQGETVYIITPEQFSFTAEKKLLESVKNKAILQAEVITFQRMAYRILTQIGGITKIPLTDSGKSMLIESILVEKQKQLQFLGRSNENVELVGRMITELKKHAIHLDQLKEIKDQMDNPYLKAKLEDISLLYEQYENRIQGQYIDEEDKLDLLAEGLEKSRLFENTIFYIDEFMGFTKQEYRILNVLMKRAKKVIVTIAAEGLEQDKSQETDIFYSNKETARKLRDIAKKENIKEDPEVILTSCKRFQTKELAHLEKYLYEPKTKVYQEEVENLRLTLAMNPFSEIQMVAKTITKLVREEGYQYRDMAIIAKNMETYSSITKAIFSQYQIPIFMDEKKEISQNVLIQYVLSILEIFAKNWSYEAMFQYLKNGLVPITKEEVFELENIVIKYGIKGKKWYIEEWKLPESEERLAKLNDIRRKIVQPLLEIKQKLGKSKTYQEISKVLYEQILQKEIQEKLQEKQSQLEQMGKLEMAKEYEKSWDILVEVLDELVMVLGEQKVSFEEFDKVLKIGLQNSGLGKIPATCDQVTMGDVDRSRTHKVKVVFMIGLNDGILPSVQKEEGFLKDKDREELKQRGIELAKGTKEALYEDCFNIYKAFTVAEEKLYLSYHSSDSAGKALRPSILLAKIKKIFPTLPEKSDLQQKEDTITTLEATFDRVLEEIRVVSEGKVVPTKWLQICQFYQTNPLWEKRLKRAIKGFVYTNEPNKLRPENLEAFYGNKLETSISQLEQYQRCAFSYYLKYGLQLSEQEQFRIQGLDTGNFMHDVMEAFFDQVLQRHLEIREMTQEQIEQMVISIVNEKLHMPRNYLFSSSAKFMVLTYRLKKVIVTSMKYIIQSLMQSDFQIYGNEVEFHQNKDYPPIVIELEDGKKVEITGKIDRIDIAKSGNDRYIRIIDYKSSVKNIDLNEVVAGLQIQLLTYLGAVTKIEEVIPAGVLYFSLIDPIVKANKNQTDEEIEEEIKKRFKMQGLILADVQVVKMMDHTLEKGASKLVPAYIDASGNLSPKFSSTVTKEQFENLQQYIKVLIRNIAKEILQGNIAVKPYYNRKKKKTPCEYCAYQSICGFQKTQGANYQFIGMQEKEEILAKIKEGNHGLVQ